MREFQENANRESFGEVRVCTEIEVTNAASEIIALSSPGLNPVYSSLE